MSARFGGDRCLRAWLVGASLVAAGCRGCEKPKEETEEAPPPPEPASSAPAAASSPVPAPPSLRAQIDQARRYDDKPYVVPTQAELDAYALWARSVVGGALTGELPRQPPPPGFVGRVVDAGRFWLLAEEDSKKRGAGLCVVRTGSARPFVIQAPHTFFDRGTLEIALLAFERLEARALLINTMRRSAGDTKEERAKDAREGDSPQDVAHVEKSFFSTAHVELTKADPELVVVQLHGFKDARAPGVAAVVSASKTRGDARAVAASLRELVPGDGIRLYPEQIDDLGGTKNRQADLSRAAKIAFVHVEISAKLRTRLKNEPELAKRFVDALGAARAGAPP